LSILIHSGEFPTTDGDRFRIFVNGRIAAMDVGELPADPTFFNLRSSQNPDEPWNDARERPVVLVPGPGNDTVTWIDIQHFADLDLTGDTPGPIHTYH